MGSQMDTLDANLNRSPLRKNLVSASLYSFQRDGFEQ